MTDLKVQSQLNKQCLSQHEGRINAMENHIEIANREMGELRDGIREVKTDVNWLKKAIWFIGTTSATTLIAVILQLVFNR
jgi:archaellum component FlaC